MVVPIRQNILASATDGRLIEPGRIPQFRPNPVR